MVVNGEKLTLEKEMSIYDYLISRGYNINIIAIEHNGEIIPKEKLKEVILKETDTLEIVMFMGGGK